MEKILQKYIKDECNKHIIRRYDYLFELNEEVKRKIKRTNINVTKNVVFPIYWEIYNGFNPYYVKSKRILRTYAYTLNRKLSNFTYSPQTALVYPINKADGSTRNVNVFTIPDSAISYYFFKSLLNKNVNLFSNYAFAYREDKNAHDAIRMIHSNWKSFDRIFVAEFDFSKFFDKIDHLYLLKIFKEKGFLFTDLEEFVIKKFLNSNSSIALSYSPISGEKRERGIPQGTSLSLFLANVACFELDSELENLGVHFARYADDTLIWSNCFEKIDHAYSIISSFSKMVGVQINFTKSEGISIISDMKEPEIRSKNQVTFLGYDINLKYISICKKNIQTIKKRISYLIYQNLLQPLKKNIFNTKRIDIIDWDYITTLSQIRRYLYGGLDDTKLLKYRFGEINYLRFRGIMSYYPIVNDEDQLKKLDGWLIYSLKQTLALREKLLATHSMHVVLPTPFGIKDLEKINKWSHPNTGKTYDLRIRSFLAINRAMKVGLTKSGINQIANPRSKYYPGKIPKNP